MTKTITVAKWTLLMLSAVTLAACGWIQRMFSVKDLDVVLILSSAFANSIALLEIPCAMKFTDTSDLRERLVRAFLILEAVLFCIILSADIHRFFGENSPWTLVASLISAIAWLPFLAFSKSPLKYFPILVTALLFSVALYVMPAMISLSAPTIDHHIFNGVAYVTGVDSLTVANFVYVRNHSWAHLAAIPLIYATFDASLYALTKTDEWRRLLPFDVSLLIIGLVLVAAGFYVAQPHCELCKGAIDHLRNCPFVHNGGAMADHLSNRATFEAGAAATMMLIANAWYLFITGNKSQSGGNPTSSPACSSTLGVQN